MRVFITGATGVIGRRVVPLLRARGHDVTVATRRQRPHAAHPNDLVRTVPVDLFDLATLTRALRDQEAVINLATHMPSSSTRMLFRRAWRDNDRIRQVGSRNLVQAALAGNVSRFVQESFALVYPDRGDCWVDESVPLQPADYNRTVLDAERSAREFSGDDRSGVALRFAAFYGPDAMQVKDYLLALRMGWAALPGGPQGFISSVSHDDAAEAVVAALAARSGEYNVVDDEPVRRETFFESLATLIGARTPRFPPTWATPLFGAVGQALSRSIRLSNGKLRAETGWKPRYPSVREGWIATLAEMERHG